MSFTEVLFPNLLAEIQSLHRNRRQVVSTKNVTKPQPKSVRIFYHNGEHISVNQRVSLAHQVPQALLVHQEQKEPADEEDRKEELETREIEVLWDHQERAENKALRDLRG